MAGLASCSAAPERRSANSAGAGDIRTKSDSIGRDLPSGSALPASASPLPVTILSRTAEFLEFEAEGEGLAAKYERVIDAEKRAEEDALARAVKEAGVNVYSGFQDIMQESAGTSYQFVGRYLNVWSDSLVSYERAGRPVCAYAADVHRCAVKIRGKVYFKGAPDPNFELRAALGKPAYFAGDDVTLRVRLTRDAYVTVLNCDEDGNVTLIYPNRHARDNFLPAGRDLDIPGELFRLTALLPPGRAETGELMHVIATKKRPLVPLDAVKEEKSGAFITYSLGGVKELVTKLSRFDRADWTAQAMIYAVKAK